MKRITFLKSLLIAAGLMVGANAWAYEVPDGWGVKNVYLGTQGSADANGIVSTVIAEDFENMESLGSAWGSGNLWTNQSSGTLFLGNITEVAKPVLNAEVNYTMDGDNKVYDKPTYVGGKAVVFHNRTNKTNNPYYGTFSFDAVSSGKFVFSGDMYFTTNASPLHVAFVDNDGNNIIDFHWNNGSGTRPFNYEYINDEGTQVISATKLNYCDYRNYKGFGIRDFILDFETGDFEFTVDFINTRDGNNIVRSQEKLTGKIQTGRNIAQMRVGTDAAGTTTVNYYTYLDNVELYTVDKTYGYVINYTNGGSTIKTETGKSFEGLTLNAANSITVDGLTYVPASNAITSLTISTSEASNVLDVPVVASVPYTITYKLGDDVIDTESGVAEAGTQVTATNTESFWKDEVKYYVTSSTTTFDVNATGNDFVVDVRLANTSAVATVNAICGGTTHKRFTATGVEGEETTIYYTIAVKSDVDGKYYTVSTDNYAKVLRYGESVNVDYTLDESIVYYTEFDGANYSESRSNVSGGTVKAYANNTVGHSTTLDAGLYTVFVKVTEGRNRSGGYRGLSISVGGNVLVDSQGKSAALHEFPITVPANQSEFHLYKGYNETDYMDYMIIRKTGDLSSTENIVVSAAGYATYVSDYNLDFSQATTKAYKVSVETKGVAKLTEVEKVPAKTPVLLFCEGGNGGGEAIAITTDAVEAVTGNNLVAGTGAALATTDGDYTNMILNNVGGKIGFYFAANQTVAKNRAYLRIASNLAPDPVSNSRMVMMFDDNQTTGISSISKGQLTKDNVFNLKGQRVANPTKGLYIVNGKKVIMK